MTFSVAEKINIALLCDLGLPEDERELDYRFIQGAVLSDDLWAIDWKYPGFGLKISLPYEVKQVVDVLEMWTQLERSYGELQDDDKKALADGDDGVGHVRFSGFDGNHGSEYHIARLLIHDLDRWANFADRDLNSHSMSMPGYERMLLAFQPIWDEKIKAMGRYELSLAELRTVLRERIHPEWRDYADNGTWTVSPRLKEARKPPGP